MKRKQLWCKHPDFPDFFIMKLSRLTPRYNKKLAIQATEYAQSQDLPYEFYVK